MKLAYSTAFDPPAPVIDALLSTVADPANTVSVVALIDTGADYTALPVGLAATLGLPLRGSTKGSGVDGRPYTLDVYGVRITTPAGTFNVDAAEFGNELLIGRDILNQLNLQFDGPGRLLSF